MSKKLDYELLEYIIAFNCTFNEVYTSSIIDYLKLDFIENTHIRNYIGIIYDFYQNNNKIPNPTELRLYLSTDDLKESYRNVIRKFKDIDTSYDFDELLCNTEQFIREKAVYNAIKKSINSFSEDDKDIENIYSLFENACNISLVDDIGFDYLNDIRRHVDHLKIQEKCISTGYAWLDKMLGGGWLEDGRALYMFMGATNVGKSIVLGNLAVNMIKQDKTVVLITMEMSEDIYAKRISSQLSRIQISQLKNETEILNNFLNDFKNSHPDSKLIIKEFPPSAISSNNIKAYLKKLEQKYKIKPDAVVLDYLTLLISAKPVGSLYVDNKAVAEQIRSLSYPQNFGCPFISAGQINRSGMTEESPGLENTSDSIGIPMTADAIFVLWQSDAEKELGVIKMGVKKNRFGVNYGSNTFKIDYDTLAIDEMGDVFSNNDTIRDTEDMLNRLDKTLS